MVLQIVLFSPSFAEDDVYQIFRYGKLMWYIKIILSWCKILININRLALFISVLLEDIAREGFDVSLAKNEIFQYFLSINYATL